MTRATVVMWTFRTPHGLWLISENNGQFVLLFNGEWLANGNSVEDIFSKISRGNTIDPSIDVKPREVLPRDITDWEIS